MDRKRHYPSDLRGNRWEALEQNLSVHSKKDHQQVAEEKTLSATLPKPTWAGVEQGDELRLVTAISALSLSATAALTCHSACHPGTRSSRASCPCTYRGSHGCHRCKCTQRKGSRRCWRSIRPENRRPCNCPRSRRLRCDKSTARPAHAGRCTGGRSVRHSTRGRRQHNGRKSHARCRCTCTCCKSVRPCSRNNSPHERHDRNCQ